MSVGPTSRSTPPVLASPQPTRPTPLGQNVVVNMATGAAASVVFQPVAVLMTTVFEQHGKQSASAALRERFARSGVLGTVWGAKLSSMSAGMRRGLKLGGLAGMGGLIHRTFPEFSAQHPTTANAFIGLMVGVAEGVVSTPVDVGAQRMMEATPAGKQAHGSVAQTARWLMSSKLSLSFAGVVPSVLRFGSMNMVIAAGLPMMQNTVRRSFPDMNPIAQNGLAMLGTSFWACMGFGGFWDLITVQQRRAALDGAPKSLMQIVRGVFIHSVESHVLNGVPRPLATVVGPARVVFGAGLARFINAGPPFALGFAGAVELNRWLNSL
ncbi:MAG: hypothetical protein AB7F28_05155 [Candidatus Margulisiibacteriota bacterium]